MKKEIQEQLSRMKDIMKLSEDFDGMSDNYEAYSRFKDSDELLTSINGRLITAILLKEWSLVEEISSDIRNFIKYNK